MLLICLSFIVTLALGVLSHFAVELWGYNYWLSFIIPASHTLFEQLKLFIFPFLIVSIVEIFIFDKNVLSTLGARIYALIIGLLILLLFYVGYTKIFETNIVAVNILIYVVSLSLTYVFAYLFSKNAVPNRMVMISFLCLLALVFFSTVWTINGPEFDFLKEIIF